ncbi:major capsid protein [uncultured Thiodictyon sp.]|uniref:major capsid protein n=1 Tax=uncultured Thiodictyon sp. TaxID=1846217 RepID=UPI0025D9F986|nr:major capsid protein [uncultured Thiodictyon sp.]
MADSANTGYGDIIVPAVFADYVTLRTASLSAIAQSGIAAPVGQIQQAVQGGGDYANLPFWGDISGDSEVLPDGETADAALTPGSISAAVQVAVKQFRGKSWSTNDMAAMVAGSDPAMAIANGVALYWMRDEQTRLIQILTGLFRTGGCLAATHVLDVSGGGRKLNGEVVIEGAQLLGDHKDMLTAIAMHSAKHSSLQAQELIEYVRDPATNEISYTTYLGKRVIIDDGCPVTNGVYTTYLFGPGAIARADVPVKVPVETQRFALQGNDVLVSRQGLVLHPAGCSYASAVAGRNPTNAKLATATSWTKVWENKQIRLVAILSR